MESPYCSKTDEDVALIAGSAIFPAAHNLTYEAIHPDLPKDALKKHRDSVITSFLIGYLPSYVIAKIATATHLQ